MEKGNPMETLSLPSVEDQRTLNDQINARIRESMSHKKGTQDKTVSSEGKQDYATPMELMAAVVRDFGDVYLDLAASQQNTKCMEFFSEEDNSLLQPWADLKSTSREFMWLNPPFKRVTPWMEKCRIEAAKGARILTLTKASAGANWFREILLPNAAVFILQSRVQFIGMDHVFTQDLAIAEWGTGKRGWMGYWDWERK
jgi:phage N-6-adenine-methyltransferase